MNSTRGLLNKGRCDARSAVPGHVAAFGALLLIFGQQALGYDLTCSELVSDPIGLYEHGLLGEDLSELVDIPSVVCPTVSRGDHSRDLCDPEAATSFPPKYAGQADWEGVDYGEELKQYFVTPTAMEVCSDIFHEDPFAAVLGQVPEVEDGVIAKYRNLELDSYQKRILNVFGAISSWNFCAHEKRDELENALVLGEFDRHWRITVYEQACYRKNLYGIDVSDLSHRHRGLLVAAHELGHALARAAAVSQSSSDLEDEHKATLLGSFVAQCAARMMTISALAYSDLIKVAEPEVVEEYDQQFADCQVQLWERMERRLSRLRHDLAEDLEFDFNTRADASVEAWLGRCLSYELE